MASTPLTDSLEDAWLVVLDTPVCVEAHSGELDENSTSEYNVIVVQLVVLDPGPGNKSLKEVGAFSGSACRRQRVPESRAYKSS